MSTDAKDEPEKADRRKLIGQAIPFALNAIWEAHSSLSPTGLASRALEGYSQQENAGSLQRSELEAILAEILQKNFRVEGSGELALILSREDLLILVGRVLKSKYAREGANNVEFELLPHDTGRDGVLRLLTRDISVKLYFSPRDVANLPLDLETARANNPSELWIFSWLPDVVERNLRFDPVFLSETRILKGGFRVEKVASIFSEITGGKFSARVIGWDPEKGKTQFRLTRIGSPTPKSESLQLGPRSA